MTVIYWRPTEFQKVTDFPSRVITSTIISLTVHKAEPVINFSIIKLLS